MRSGARPACRPGAGLALLAWDSPCVCGFCSSRAGDSVMHSRKPLPAHRDLRRTGDRTLHPMEAARRGEPHAARPPLRHRRGDRDRFAGRHAVRPRGGHAHFPPEQDRPARSVAHARLHAREPASHLRHSGAAASTTRSPTYRPIRTRCRCSNRPRRARRPVQTAAAAQPAPSEPPATDAARPRRSPPACRAHACCAARKPAAAGRRCRHGRRARGRRSAAAARQRRRRRRPRSRTGRAIAGAASGRSRRRRSKRRRLRPRRSPSSRPISRHARCRAGRQHTDRRDRRPPKRGSDVPAVTDEREVPEPAKAQTQARRAGRRRDGPPRRGDASRSRRSVRLSGSATTSTANRPAQGFWPARLIERAASAPVTAATAAWRCR